MLKKSALILVLTLTLANGAFAAVRHNWSGDNYNSTVPPQSSDQQLFERAKGSID